MASVRIFCFIAKKCILYQYSVSFLLTFSYYILKKQGGIKISVNGIDVSVWQGTIDWKKVKTSGVSFAMARASYGKSLKDKNFDTNMTNAQAQGMDMGVYHYCLAKTEKEAIQEADFFISIIKKYKFPYPAAVDIEDNSLTSLTKDKITNIALSFMGRLKEFGFYPMLYANKYWLTNYIDTNRIKDYSIWLAEYMGGQYTYKGRVDMWQNSSTGTVNGISGFVDTDIAYVDFPKIIKAGGYNGMEKEALTVEESKKIIQEKCGFTDDTMLYLSFYKYSDSLITRLAEQML